MKFIPLFDRVLLTPEKKSSVTGSGISFNTASGFIYGRVAAVGNNIGESLPMQVKAGEVVIFEEHTSCKINLGDKIFYLIKQTDILAKAEDEAWQNN